ncbi:TetR/AcrR family transcriptional regulator [Haliangium sp.]|uniref:TetR/AcrR family transcriptional regulator n=2 Tax=Haliangium sp. TaxID=2663208 RepID=UPI003D13056C
MRAVVEAAARVFDREGMEATTNRIAEEAGVSIGSLYQYFPNKEALLMALAERHLEDGEAALQAAATAVRDAASMVDVVRGLVGAAAAAHREHPRMHEVLELVASRTPEVLARARGLKVMLEQELARHLRRLRPELDQPERKAALAATVIGGAMHELVVGAEPDPAQVDEIVALCTVYLDADGAQEQGRSSPAAVESEGNS